MKNNDNLGKGIGTLGVAGVAAWVSQYGGLGLLVSLIIMVIGLSVIWE